MEYPLAGLWFSAFLAATLLPLPSEAVVIGLWLSGQHDATTLWLVATCGNVAGSSVNWATGYGLAHLRHKAWFPFTPATLHAAELRFQRYGTWSLLFAWVPIIGDPLTFVAGLLRVHFIHFACWVSLGKGGRYAAVLLMLPDPV
jgi:membrane protein YqaA with SNARE-associated domain